MRLHSYIRKHHSRILHIACLLILLEGQGGARAQQLVTVDFEACSRAGTSVSNWGPLYHERGFSFANVNANPIYPNDGSLASWNRESGPGTFMGSTMLFNQTAGAELSVSRIEQGYFDFVSIDLAPLSSTQAMVPLEFRGYRGADLIVSELFVPTGNSLQTFEPQQSFSNLTEVRWTQSGQQFDNVMLIPREGPSPHLQMSIASSNSTLRFSCSYMVPGSIYVLQRWTDSSSWQTRRNLIFYAPTGQIDEAPAELAGIYRLIKP